MATNSSKKVGTQPRQIRIPDGDWEDFERLTKLMETDRSTAIREFITWYMRKPGRKLPSRPTLEQVRSIHASESTASDAESP